MSLDSLTGDEFMNLDAETHEDAINLYEEAIEKLNREATSYHLGGPITRAVLDMCLDKLTSYLQLRKMHKRRLAELQENDLLPAPLPTSERYVHTELASA